MSTEKFTPGEWEVKSRYTEWESTEKKIYSTQVIAPSAGYIISSIDTKDEKLLDMIQANAHLISAAPKMYRMLDITKQMFENLADVLPNEQAKDLCHDMASDIIAVLEKARGKE